MEKIMSDRDDRDHTNRSRVNEQNDKKDIIDNMVQMAKYYFAPHRNIHIFTGGKEILFEQIMHGDDGSYQ